MQHPTNARSQEKDVQLAYPYGGPLFYRVARAVCAAFCRLAFRVKVDGRENIPNDRNFILLSNHINAWDPIVLVAACPQWEIRFLAKESLFKFAPLRYVLKHVNAIRIARGGSNLAAMRAALDAVRRGHTLGIFPEGHRFQTGKIETLQTGVVMIVMNTDAPLLPAHVAGEYGFRKTIRVRFGAPIEMNDLRKLPKDADTIERIKVRLWGILSKLS